MQLTKPQQKALLRLLQKMQAMVNISPTLAAAADIGAADKETLFSLTEQLERK